MAARGALGEDEGLTGNGRRCPPNRSDTPNPPPFAAEGGLYSDSSGSVTTLLPLRAQGHSHRETSHPLNSDLTNGYSASRRLGRAEAPQLSIRSSADMARWCRGHLPDLHFFELTLRRASIFGGIP